MMEGSKKISQKKGRVESKEERKRRRRRKV
jgi:hypothetical protein